MNVLTSDLKKDKTIVSILMIAGFFTIMNVLLCVIYYGSLPPVIPLYNQMPWGQERLGQQEQIFIPVLIPLILLIVNSVVSSAIYSKIPLAARMLSVTVFLSSLFMFLFITRLLLLVI